MALLPRPGRAPFLRISSLHPRGAVRVFVAASLLFPLAITAACWIDGTLVMAAPGKGLRQHYGYWAIFVTTPCIILLTAHLYEKFTTVIRETDRYCVGLTGDYGVRLDRLVQRHLQSLSLHARTVWVLAFIIFVFFCWWLVNVINTVSPTRTYRHDVFDAYSHPFGFYLAKTYFLFVLAIVYSMAVFFALHVTASMIDILKFICRNNMLCVNFFHPDNCGGMSQFGNINLIILCIAANFFVVIYALYVTHGHTYLSMSVSLLACSVFATAISVMTVSYIRKAVAQKKREWIDAVSAALNSQIAATLQGERFRDDLLAFRTHLMSIRTVPYAANALVAVNLIRFAPAAVAVAGYFKGP